MSAQGGDITISSADINLAATQKIYFDGGVHTYISESASDPETMRFSVGGTQVMNLTEDGTNGSRVHFKSSCAGFTQATASFGDSDVVGDGGYSTDIDFRFTNKIWLAVTNDIPNLNLIFPSIAGNFVLLLTYDGDHDITDYKVYRNGNPAASGDADVLWPGGSAPATTDSGADILSFYWDPTAQKCYGVGSLNFSN